VHTQQVTLSVVPVELALPEALPFPPAGMAVGVASTRQHNEGKPRR